MIAEIFLPVKKKRWPEEQAGPGLHVSGTGDLIQTIL